MAISFPIRHLNDKTAWLRLASVLDSRCFHLGAAYELGERDEIIARIRRRFAATASVERRQTAASRR